MIDRIATPGLCHLNLAGDTRFAFEVEPAVGLVTPTSVAVIVNPPQIRLLRAEAERLRAKAKELRSQLRSEDVSVNHTLLRSAVLKAMADLKGTEERYKEEGVKPSDAQTVNLFFHGIRLNYDAALQALSGGPAQVRLPVARLRTVNAARDGGPPRLDPVSLAAFASISHHVNTYEAAASSGYLTLPLWINSDPRGATIWKRLLRDKEYVKYDDVTNSELELVIGTWFFKLQLTGFPDWCGRFDAAEDKRTSINADLSKGSCQ
jgi:hypothetical protein